MQAIHCKYVEIFSAKSCEFLVWYFSTLVCWDKMLVQAVNSELSRRAHERYSADTVHNNLFIALSKEISLKHL